MPLTIPNLDDRSYDDLVAEAIAMIPRYAPTWTNYNPSDPGITIIELLAYFTELLIYRLDRVGIKNKANFLRLLTKEPDNQPFDNLSHDELDAKITKAVLALKEPHRAITAQDYERLAEQAFACQKAGFSGIDDVRAHCVFGKNLETEGNLRNADRPGHVSVVLVAGKNSPSISNRDWIEEIEPNQYSPVVDGIKSYLEQKCLLTTRLHVVTPCYIWISFGVTLGKKPVFLLDDLLKICAEKINEFFNPFGGGGKGYDGWHLGRNVYLSEVIEILEQIPEVDFIENPMALAIATTTEKLNDADSKIGIQVGVYSQVGVDSVLGTKESNNHDRFILDGAGRLSGIKLKPYELPRVVIQEHSQQIRVSPDAVMKDDYV